MAAKVEAKKQIADLERTNAELEQSLERCSELLEKCESQLAANDAAPCEGRAATSASCE